MTLFNFSLAGSGPAADLDTDLAKHNTTYGGTKGVTLEITFPDEFPSAPPNVFLRHPILRDGTGVRCHVRPVLRPRSVCLSLHGTAEHRAVGCVVTVSLVTGASRASSQECASCLRCAPRAGTTTTAWRK